jgi:hypothetical protein
MMNKNRAIVKTDGMRIDEELFSTRFACDLSACKGACCTMPGGSGAPVSESELPLLESAWNIVRHRVPRAHEELVRREGLFVREPEGWTIRCLDHRACVFVIYDGGVAKCSIQQAYQNGEYGWPKPASCHLFPLRVRGASRKLLVYEEYPECAPALERGRKNDIPLYLFLEHAIRRVFGDAFWEAMAFEGRSLNGGETGKG